MRIWLKHGTPDWVQYPEFFITICTRPRHLNQLCHPTSAPLILQSAENYHLNHRWNCSLIPLMQDHLDALIQVPEKYKLTQVIGSWKGYLAKKLDIRWHRGFFDNRIRRSESLNEKWNYIVMNPVHSALLKTRAIGPIAGLPKVRMTVPVILGRAGCSSVPSSPL